MHSHKTRFSHYGSQTCAASYSCFCRSALAGGLRPAIQSTDDTLLLRQESKFAAAFRILKFFFIGMCAWLGFFGFLIALLAIFLHLASLKSFGIPYLMPFAGADLTNYQDERDSLLRVPLFYLKKRPIFASRRNKTRLRWKE